ESHGSAPVVVAPPPSAGSAPTPARTKCTPSRPPAPYTLLLAQIQYSRARPTGAPPAPAAFTTLNHCISAWRRSCLGLQTHLRGPRQSKLLPLPRRASSLLSVPRRAQGSSMKENRGKKGPQSRQTKWL